MTQRIGNYIIGEVLGEGSFGLVKLGQHINTKQKYAIKILEKDKIKKNQLMENLKKEIGFMMCINHENIVKLYEVLASKTKIYLILEYLSGGDLYENIRKNGKIPENKLKIYIRQIITALKYCKQQNIAHRDIKAENVLMSHEGTVKISDFGLSAFYDNNKLINSLLNTTCGTISYLSPEVVSNQEYDGHLVDIWAVGVLIYYGAFGVLPFVHQNLQNLLQMIVQVDYQIPSSSSKNLKNLLQNILVKNPNKRCSLEFIFNHPWIQDEITQQEIKKFIDIDKNHLSYNLEIQLKNEGKVNYFDFINQNYILFLIQQKQIEAMDVQSERNSFISAGNFNEQSQTYSLVESNVESQNFKPRFMNCLELINLLQSRIMNTQNFSDKIYLKDIMIQKMSTEQLRQIQAYEIMSINLLFQTLLDNCIFSLQNIENIQYIKIVNPFQGCKIEFKTQNQSNYLDIFQLHEQQHLLLFTNTSNSNKFSKILYQFYQKFSTLLDIDY